MEKVSLIVIKQDCIGCHACEVACRQEHGLNASPALIKVLEKGPLYVPIYCHHCAKPPCKEACPVEAIWIDDRGIVLINEAECIGCKACFEACPFGAVQFDEIKGVALKCDLCLDRITEGEEPACARACPTRCILWGSMREILSRREAEVL